MIYGPDGFGSRNILAINEAKTPVPLKLRSTTDGKSRARVTVVDLNSRETLAMYLLLFDADKPLIESAPRIICRVGAVSFYTMKYENPVAREMAVFEVTSTNPALLNPAEPVLTMQPRDTEELRFEVPAQKHAGLYECVVHLSRVTDPEKNEEPFSTSMLFMIQVNK